MNQSWRYAVVLAALFYAGAAPAVEPRILAPESIVQWQAVEFDGRTDYRLLGAADAGAGHAAIEAECRDGTASGLLLEQRIDLLATPILEWRWRVDLAFSGTDERTRAGDDHAARVYLVHERWPRWRSRVVNYVYSSSQPAGAAWPNPFSERFAMLAVAGRGDSLGLWRTERRDVRADFRALHGIEIDHVDAIAIMTDCDNTAQPARAAYGPIRWLPDS